MATRAALGRIDFPVVDELGALRDLRGRGGRLVRKVGDFVQRTQDLLGITVALEAEEHVEGFLLADDDLLVDPPMALDAADAAVHVDGVVEINIIRHLVDLDPTDRLARLDALLHERQRWAIRLHLAVAVPAGVGGGDVGVPGLLDVVVAITAIQAQNGIRPRVKGMVEGDRLVWRVSDVQILVGGVFVDRRDYDDSGDEKTDEDLEGGGVDGPGEKVAAGGRAVKEFEELAHR